MWPWACTFRLAWMTPAAASSATIPGVANNSGDAIRISIQGHGVHGSKIHLGVDAINIAAHTIIAPLQEILALEIPSTQPAVVLVGQNGGRFQLQQCGGQIPPPWRSRSAPIRWRPAIS